MFPAHKFALAQPYGNVNWDLVMAYGRAMAYHPDWRPGYTEVWDVRFSRAVDIVPSDIPRFLELEEETEAELKGSETIVIADRAALVLAVPLYNYVVRPKGRSVRAVRTGQEAAEILGIPEIPDLRR